MKMCVSWKQYSKLVCLLLPVCCPLLTSCSTLLDRSTSRHRGILESKGTRVEFREKIGKPVESWQQPEKANSKYKRWDTYAYDVFSVRGQVAKPGDGMSQATVAAVSLGGAEVISLPFTILGVGGKLFKKETLIVYYNKQLKYKTHRIFDRKGEEVDRLGY